MRINALNYGSLQFFHPRQNFDTFQNLTPSELANTIRTVLDSANAFTDQFTDRYGQSVPSCVREWDITAFILDCL